MNEYESHRHASQYNMSLIVKRFSFAFVNNYLTLLYLLFVDRVRAPAGAGMALVFGTAR